MSSLPPKRWSRVKRPTTDLNSQFQICERRLVLSAQLLLDTLSAPPLQTHGTQDIPIAIDNGVATPAVEPQTTAAHNLAGWTQVQQQFGLTGKGQTVAVIDSGIAWDHVALGRGFGPGYRVVGGWDFAENDANPYDDGPSGFHGTHVSGIIGSDDARHPGVAPDVDLVALRVFNDAGQGQLSWVEKALQWVYANRNSFENPITTVNLSIGTSWNASTTPNWAMLEDEFQQLYNEGIVVTASAGNSFRQYNAPGLSYPAASSYVIPVASVDGSGQLSDFSQRNERVIAAPGQSITSTVPDHLLGRDGRVNDFSSASGTSMAAPYVAGATVLIRQAMEMAGWSNISPDTITQHLHNTADRVFDAITQASYSRLDLQQAIDAIIPDDSIGDSSSTASTISIGANRLNGWINSLSDVDVYRFTADASGSFRLDAQSDWVESLNWTVSSNGQTVGSGDLNPANLRIIAGQSYEIRVAANQEIGPFQLDWTFQADASTITPPTTTNIGSVNYWENSVAAGQIYRAQATQDGTFSVLWNNPDSANGLLRVSSGNGLTVTDSTWENGILRVDIQAQAGEWFNIQTPGQAQDQGELAVANALVRNGTSLTVTGGNGADNYSLNLSSGTNLTIGKINYQYATGQIANLTINALGGDDQIHIVGSTLSESINLTPTQSILESSQLRVVMNSVEQVAFVGGGGADVAYLYDTHTDDSLISRPNRTEMTGAGYKYIVSDMGRTFVNATAGGNDIAYLYDSSGDDRLSVRPQFTSISGPGYFNYISGFERVFAYATAGGNDLAEIYDSARNDLFVTSGESASITGPGFASFTRFFERVNAYATSGGNDVAMLYGSSSQTRWQQGVDFVNFRESNWSREARGFQAIEAYVGTQQLNLAQAALPSVYTSPASLPLADSPLQTNVQATEASNAERVFSAPLASLHQPTFSSPAIIDGWERETTEQFHDALLATESLESQLLAETQALQAWLTEETSLPDDLLVNDRQLERAVLDEIFACQADEGLM